jgi:hypothetical protein
MSQKAGNWIIAAGVVVMLFGLSVLPAALGDRHDSSTLAVAACLFSLGSLTTAGGIYIKARALKAAPGSAAAAREAGNSHRKQKGGCDACQADVPVIQCTVHRVHLCAGCLARHYDFRSCAYMPTTRRTASRGSKSAAVRAGRA